MIITGLGLFYKYQLLSLFRAKRSFTDEQNEDFDRHGFAYLNKEQMDLMFANKKCIPYIILIIYWLSVTKSQGMNTTALGNMSRDEKDKWIEQKIRQISSYGRKEWPFWNGL